MLWKSNWRKGYAVTLHLLKENGLDVTGVV